MPRMTSFPGAIYDGQGASLNPTVSDLTREQIDACPHSSMVTMRAFAPVARVWLLANDATPGAIPPVLMMEAVKLVLAGKGVLILAQRPEPEVDVRTGLLQDLDLFTVPGGVIGQAQKARGGTLCHLMQQAPIGEAVRRQAHVRSPARATIGC